MFLRLLDPAEWLHKRYLKLPLACNKAELNKLHCLVPEDDLAGHVRSLDGR